MKKLFLVITILSASVYVTASAQATPERLAEDHTRAACLFHSYEFNEISDVKPPKGYKPFYISHYGRHGSRHHTSAEYFADALNALNVADSSGNLTLEGQLLRRQMDSLYSHHDGMWGQLTGRGAEEQKKLAVRMFERFPEVFTDRERNEMDTYSSDVPRCILSLGSFTGSLRACAPGLELTYETGARCSKYLRCGSAFAKKHYEPMMHEAIDSSCDWTELMDRIFVNPSEAGISPYEFASDVWGGWAICQCLETVHIDILRYYTPEQLCNTWKYRSLYYYLMFVRSDVYGERSVNAVKGLLEDFVSKADEALSGDAKAATIRFGHDSTLMPLAGLMGLEGFHKAYSAKDPCLEDWDLGTNVCMGSNIQMVFYRNRKGNVLVKFLYNEKEAAIPALTPEYGGCYYSWENVRNHFIQTIRTSAR